MWWGWFVCRCLSLAALLVVADCGGAEQRRGAEEGLRSSTAKANSSSGRKYHRIQHGQCSYTFILPEGDGGSCREFKAGTPYNANALQRDAPQPEADFSNQKIQQLEHVMENYTQWLQKIENYIKDNMKTEIVQLQQSAVHNHTAAMLEMGTSLLSQTAEQTRKLTNVETQVLNQTSRLEIQLLENSLSTNKLEKELMIQINEINKIHDKNGHNQHNQGFYFSFPNHFPNRRWEKLFIRRNQIFRPWKQLFLGFGSGFGSVSAEHWLGNEFVHILTNQREYALRVELTDWDEHQVFSQYDSFHIDSEKHNYRLFLKSHSGTAGRQSSLAIHGADFSTKDMDNDNCTCKCALMLSGGWWYDACGPSNLNGVYYRQGQHVGKFNGIKWHYFKGPSYSLRSTVMMIRPADFA
uniref:Angiopoietin-1-like n=1 Tax=Sinocyclocheilus grahami TaxID=75366 RepID=A0A672PID8_SINGR